nr:hypothetical protein [uncultured Lacibacter sp.]
MKFNLKPAGFMLALIVSTSLFTVSCKKPVSEGNKNTILKTVSSGDEEITFTYNANGSIKSAAVKNGLISSGSLVNYQVSYTAQGKISSIVSDDDVRIVPEYEGTVLLKSTFESLDGTHLLTTTYDYDNGLLKSVIITDDAGDPVMKFAFQHTGSGNVSKAEFFTPDFQNPGEFVSSGTVDYTFDTKPNPLFAARDILHLLWVPASPNNQLTEVHKDKNGTLEETVNYTYQYHGNGMPKSATMQTTVAGQQPQTSAISYQYF